MDFPAVKQKASFHKPECKRRAARRASVYSAVKRKAHRSRRNHAFDNRVLGEEPITAKADRVVAYESAHIDGVASEVVIRATFGRKSILRRLRKCIASSGSILKLKVGLVDESRSPLHRLQLPLLCTMYCKSTILIVSRCLCSCASLPAFFCEPSLMRDSRHS